MFVSKTSSRRLQDTSSRRLQDVFRVIIFRLSRRLQDVLEDEKLLRWRRVEYVFMACLEDVFKTSWRPTNVYCENNNIIFTVCNFQLMRKFNNSATTSFEGLFFTVVKFNLLSDIIVIKTKKTFTLSFF